jgi:acetyl esterase/lipase
MNSITWLSRISYTTVLVLSVTGRLAADEPSPRVSLGANNDRGFVVHSVSSPYQAGTTTIRVLLPDRIDEKTKHPVLYVLPVEAKDGRRYGDGLLEVKKAGLHNRYGLICVAPTFSHLPWYADHPTDKTIRQESYFLKVVVPFIEKTYPVLARPEGRLLVGFSKSGWGAFALLLRHPEVFGKAAAWDAPLMKDKPNQFGMKQILGTQANFEKYRIAALLKQRAELLKKSCRLVLTGYGNFRAHHQQAHRLMKELGVKCQYRDGPKRKHRWNNGWLEEAVDLLISDSRGAKPPAGPKPMPLWGGKKPLSKARITVHRPAKGNGTAIVICPGGGYGGLVTGPEGHGIARWLNKHGITGIVLEYELPRGRPEVPLRDAQRAIRTARAHAKAWKLDPHRIGIMGFSAGGHLAATAGTHFDSGHPKAADPIDRESCRPDFMVLIYPVITMREKPHRGSRRNLLGKNPNADTVKRFSNETQVTKKTPPAFLAHAKDDKVVPAEHSRMFQRALKAKQVPAEYLELPRGGHGLNGYRGPMWDAWQAASLHWMASQRMIPPQR